MIACVAEKTSVLFPSVACCDYIYIYIYKSIFFYLSKLVRLPSKYIFSNEKPRLVPLLSSFYETRFPFSYSAFSTCRHKTFYYLKKERRREGKKGVCHLHSRPCVRMHLQMRLRRPNVRGGFRAHYHRTSTISCTLSYQILFSHL